MAKFTFIVRDMKNQPGQLWMLPAAPLLSSREYAQSPDDRAVRPILPGTPAAPNRTQAPARTFAATFRIHASGLGAGSARRAGPYPLSWFCLGTVRTARVRGTVTSQPPPGTVRF